MNQPSPAPKAIVDYLEVSDGEVKVYRCPECNAWDWALQDDPSLKSGVYQCTECGIKFEIKVG